MVILPCEHGHGMVENVASTLHTLIQPCRPMFLLIKRNRESLTTTVIYRIDNGNVEFVGVLRQVVRT